MWLVNICRNYRQGSEDSLFYILPAVDVLKILLYPIYKLACSFWHHDFTGFSCNMKWNRLNWVCLGKLDWLLIRWQLMQPISLFTWRLRSVSNSWSEYRGDHDDVRSSKMRSVFTMTRILSVCKKGEPEVV